MSGELFIILLFSICVIWHIAISLIIFYGGGTMEEEDEEDDDFI